MKLECVLRITLLLLMMALSHAQSTGRPITCNAGTFPPRQPAAVTCNLHTNFSATELGFNVVRHLPHALDHDLGKDILVCEWKTEERKHDCNVMVGYAFNIGQESVTINIPAVTEEAAGLYMCYFLPQDTGRSHPCELIVAEVPRGNATLPQTTIATMIKPADKGEPIHVLVIILAVVLLIVFPASLAAIGVYFFIKRRRSQKQKKKIRRDEHDEFGQMSRLLPNAHHREHVPVDDETFVQETWGSLNDKIKAVLKGIMMHTELCKKVMQLQSKELDSIRSGKLSRTSNMCSTLVNRLPTGPENGEFMVLNLNSRLLKILFVKIACEESEDIDIKDLTIHKIPQDIRLGTCNQLLNFIQNRVSIFLSSKQLGDNNTSVGVVFSFPCKYTVDGDLTTARPSKWTKGFNCDGVLGKEFGKLLQQTFNARNMTHKLDIKVVINDTVGILMAGAHEDRACRIAFAIGNGVNGCYIKDNEPDMTAGVNSAQKMIIATEWGSLGEGADKSLDEGLDKLRTEFDRTAVKLSMHPEEQIVEKMVGKLYIGEIVREVLLKLVDEGLLFTRLYSDLPALNMKRGFPSECVLEIDRDMDNDCSVTREQLQWLDFGILNLQDCKLVKLVCKIVVRRAAAISAAALAALVKHVDQRDIKVAIDGSLWRSHLPFKEHMEATVNKLLESQYNVTFLPIFDATEIGAALTTAVSLHSDSV